ncbi:adenosine deaminase-like protein [Leishmania tarentolae]|uniref:tRNA-specific adenosine deaminase 1 n=1 Tax=Leishmania tarentolae TaxID=5689 RepID=A0A640KRW9_LEITA|nr:adenosine deaminase-like protein [Leishmania tarentolae]
MEDKGTSTLAERSGQFGWIPDHLWSDTPHGAVHRAVEAQPQPVWRQLWHRALMDGALRPGSSCAAADTSEQEACLKGKESANIVAAFVLSIPNLECPCPQEAEALESGAKTSMRRYICVSLGSGSRCLAAHDAPASDAGEKVRRLLELRDGHAEVMARRGFIAFLLGIAEVSARCRDDAYADLFLCRCSGDRDAATPVGSSVSPQWRLRESTAVHLVCTRWMCGSLAAVAGGSGRSGHLLLRAACGCWLDPTMQKDFSEKEADHASFPITHVDRHTLAAHYSPLNGASPLLHAARVKPGKGRANLSMSCTDKVWRWYALGVQGHRRASLFPVPMRLSSIHVLHSPFKDFKDLQAAEDNAAATFEWRGRRWWSQKDSDMKRPAAPKFAFFSATEFSSTHLLTSVKPHDAGVPIDSNYSRSRWLCVRSAVTNRKRGRDEGPDGPSVGSTTYSWQCFPCHGDHDCSLVLNTKAGLPQGMTGRALARRCSTSAEIPWQQCPLSRPWMYHRVKQLQIPHTEILPISCMKAIAAPDLLVTAATGGRDAQTSTTDTKDLSMSQRVHRHHLQPLGADEEPLRLLWASTSHIDCLELLLEAKQNLEGVPF